MWDTRRVPRPPSPTDDERVIVALDLPDAAAALDLVDRIGPATRFYKVGLELFCAGQAGRVMDGLAARGARVFCDTKLWDVPTTVRRAAQRLVEGGADLISVHADPPTVAAAVDAAGPGRVLAVTVLTSMGPAELAAAGYASTDPTELVLRRARVALEAGAGGLVASGREAARLRAALGAGFRVVTPGIRSGGDRPPGDDQVRTVSAAEAVAAGADQVVVGRPVRDATDPQAAVAALRAEVASALRRAGPLRGSSE